MTAVIFDCDGTLVDSEPLARRAWEDTLGERDYVVTDDLQALAKDALRHRLVLSYQALAEEVSPDSILEQVLAAVPVPQIDLTRATAA